VSYATAAVVSGIPPIKLLAEERTNISHGRSKTEAKKVLLEEWQKEWDEDQQGRWTHRLIGGLDQWTNRKFGDVTFHLT